MAVLQRYVASHAQRDLWSLQKLVPESAAYNVVSAWRIRSRVDDGALAEALVEGANRHDALRTTSRERDDRCGADATDLGRGPSALRSGARTRVPAEALHHFPRRSCPRADGSPDRRRRLVAPDRHEGARPTLR